MNETIQATIEDMTEVETNAELGEYQKLLDSEYYEVAQDDGVSSAIQAARERLTAPVLSKAETINELEGLMAQLALLRSTVPVPDVVEATERRTGSAKKYRLLKDAVTWSQKSQVHAVMAILNKVVKVGDVVSEDEIIDAMYEHQALLNTRQTPERIWNYFKGMSGDGLMAHGAIERA